MEKSQGNDFVSLLDFPSSSSLITDMKPRDKMTDHYRSSGLSTETTVILPPGSGMASEHNLLTATPY